MADLSITATSVQMSSSSEIDEYTAGEAISQGEPVYIASADNKAYLAIAGDTEAKAKSVGIAVTAAATGAKVIITDSGDLTIGATLTLNTLYVVSATAGGGKICPLADLVTDDWVVPLGIPKTTLLLDVNPDPRGFQIP